MIFRFLFLLTLVPAVYMGFRRGGDFLFVAIILSGSFAISLFGWSVINPIWTNAVADTLCAAFVAIFCTQRQPIRIGFLFVAAALVSIAYGVYIYPETRYEIWYAHTLSVLGHLQNVALLFGAADDGIRDSLRKLLWKVGSPVFRVGLYRRRSDSEADGS